MCLHVLFKPSTFQTDSCQARALSTSLKDEKSKYFWLFGTSHCCCNSLPVPFGVPKQAETTQASRGRVLPMGTSAAGAELAQWQDRIPAGPRPWTGSPAHALRGAKARPGTYILSFLFSHHERIVFFQTQHGSCKKPEPCCKPL